MQQPEPRPITLDSIFWRDTVLPVVQSAIPHQPDRMFTNLATAIRQRCTGTETATLNATAGRWAAIWNRICDEMWRNRDLPVTFRDLEPLRKAIHEIVYGTPQTDISHSSP